MEISCFVRWQFELPVPEGSSARGSKKVSLMYLPIILVSKIQRPRLIYIDTFLFMTLFATPHEVSISVNDSQKWWILTMYNKKTPKV